MRLEDIATGNSLTGVEPTLIVSVVAVVPEREKGEVPPADQSGQV